MTRDLDSELARLARNVRRRVAFLDPRRGAVARRPVALTFRERVVLIWDQERARVRRWLGAR